MAQWAYGKNTVLQLLNDQSDILELWIQKNTKQDEVLKLAGQQRIAVRWASKEEMNAMAQGNHQGVAVKIKDYTTYPLSDLLIHKGSFPLLVMCDQLEDPHNLGAILRTCDGVGADGVIIGKHRSVSLTPTVAKVSTGAINTVKVAEVTNLVQSAEWLKKQGYWIIGTDNSKEAINYSDLTVDMPIVLVVGSEGKGISRLLREKVDVMVKIPMVGSITSLNVSVATGVLLYDIIRKRSLL